MAFRQRTLSFPPVMAPGAASPLVKPEPLVKAELAPHPSALPLVPLPAKTRERDLTPFDDHRSVKHKCDLDLDALQCSACALHLSPPVFQCQNGHTVCSPCCTKISERCPLCAHPAGKFIRCLIAEKILDSLRVACPNAPKGCKEMLKYTTRDDHATNWCQHRPCACPAPGCGHQGPKQALARHLAQEHQVRTVELRLIPHNSVCSEVNFKMAPSEGYVMVRAVNQGVQLLVHREEVAALGIVFFCTSFDDFTTLYNLRVMMLYGKDYIMANASAADLRRREGWRRDLLLYAVSGPSPTFDVGLRVFTMANICK